jgi:hypothetical protein
VLLAAAEIHVGGLHALVLRVAVPDQAHPLVIKVLKKSSICLVPSTSEDRMPALSARLGLILCCLAVIPRLAAESLADTPAHSHRGEWKLDAFTWVKLAPHETGAAPNEQPVTLAPGTLALDLGSIQLSGPLGDEPLFAKDELAALAGPLSEAFAAAAPDQDVELVSTYRRSGTGFLPPKAVTVRLFHQGGALEVIVHDARLDFLDTYYRTRAQPQFTFGSRREPGPVQLLGPLGRRPDWLYFLDGRKPVPAAPEPLAADAPARAAMPSAPPVRAWDEAACVQREQHLKALQRLRDENLISEDEFQQKRQKVIDDL